MKTELEKISKNLSSNSSQMLYKYFIENINKIVNATPPLKEEPEKNKHFIQLTLVLMSMLITMGIVGNLINIVVFSQPNMRKISTFRFLLYLAITDLLVLLVCSTDAFAKFGYHWEIRLQSSYFCRFHTFLTYLLTHSSSTILMAVSVDRALVVTNQSVRSIFGSMREIAISRTKMYSMPSKRSSHYHKPTKSKLSIFGRRFHHVDIITVLIFIILTLLNSHYLIFLDLKMILERETERGRTSMPFDMSFLVAMIKNLPAKSKSPNQTMAVNKTKTVVANLNGSGLIPKLSKSSNSLLFNEFFINEQIQKSGLNFVKACFPDNGTPYYNFLSHYWFIIDMCLYWFIPFLVMSICSFIILSKIRTKNRKYFKKLLNNLNNRVNRTIIYKRSKKSRQILYMLLMTNVYFLLSQLPYCIMFMSNRGTQSDSTLSQLIVHLIGYTNNAFNFLFYGVSSQFYRKQLLKIFKRTFSRK